MATTVGELQVVVTANIKGLQQSISQAQKLINDFAKKTTAIKITADTSQFTASMKAMTKMGKTAPKTKLPAPTLPPVKVPSNYGIQASSAVKSFQQQVDDINAFNQKKLQELGVPVEIPTRITPPDTKPFLSAVTGALDQVSSKLMNIGSSMESVGRRMSMYITAPLVGLGKSSVSSAMDFTKGVSKTMTLVDPNVMSRNDVSKYAINLSNQLGANVSDVNESMYQALSSNISTKNLPQFTDVANKLAIAGFTSNTNAVDLLTSMKNAYNLPDSDAYALANRVIVTQNNGKTTADALAPVIGNIMPTASQAGLSMDEVLSAIAGITVQRGMKNTPETITSMRSMLQNILKPSAQAKKMASALDPKGDSSWFSAENLKKEGLVPFLEEVQKRTGGNTEAMEKLFGNVRGVTGVFQLLNSQGLDVYKRNMTQINDGQDTFAKNLKIMEDSPDFKINQSLTQMKNSMIEIGSAILPTVSQILKQVADFVQNLADKFNALSPTQQDFITKGLMILAVSGPVLMYLGLMFQVVGGLFKGFSMLTGVMSSVAGWFKTLAGGASATSGGFLGISGATLATIGTLVAFIGEIVIVILYWRQLLLGLQEGALAVGTAFVTIAVNIESFFDRIFGGIVDKWNALVNQIKGSNVGGKIADFAGLNTIDYRNTALGQSAKSQINQGVGMVDWMSDKAKSLNDNYDQWKLQQEIIKGQAQSAMKDSYTPYGSGNNSGIPDLGLHYTPPQPTSSDGDINNMVDNLKKMQDASKDTADSMKQLADSINNTTKQFSDGIGMLDKFNKKTVTMGTLLNRARRRNDEFTQWQQARQTIMNRAEISDSLKQQLMQMGVDKAGELEALAGASSDQLAQWNAMEQNANNVAKQEATTATYENQITIYTQSKDASDLADEIMKKLKSKGVKFQ